MEKYQNGDSIGDLWEGRWVRIQESKEENTKERMWRRWRRWWWRKDQEEKVVGEHREERADRGEAKVGQVFK